MPARLPGTYREDVGRSTMTRAQDILQTHPTKSQIDEAALSACVESLIECAETCTSCADSCLGEENVKDLVHCIRLDLDCADICQATGRILGRQTSPSLDLVRSQLEACIVACQLCGDECEKHETKHAHCRVCAESCRNCEEACQRLVESMTLA